MSKYDFELDLDSENSLSNIINMIKPKSKVLEFGPANGRMTKYLSRNMNCEIDIVEMDESAGIEASQYSNKSFVGEDLGDIEKYKWLEELKNEQYDYIVFADVLEHLRFPQKILKACKKILKDKGSIIISAPNIAHNSVIIDLINDEFKYNEVGLLDNTHISFFSYKSLVRMIEESGYKTVIERATYCGVGENEINNNYNCVSKEFSKALRKRDKGNLYQFVFEVKKKEHVMICSPLKEVNLGLNSEYEFKCYVKEGSADNYSEVKKISKFINPSNNIIKLELEFNKFKEIQGLRIDPIEENCVIDIKKIYTIVDEKKVDVNVLYTSGINLFGSTYMFSASDPQIYVDVKGMNIKTLYYEYIFIDYDSNNINKYEELLKNIIEHKNLNIKEKENIISEKEQSIEDNRNNILEYKVLLDDTRVKLEVKNQENDRARSKLLAIEEELKNKENQVEELNSTLENYKVQNYSGIAQIANLKNRLLNTETSYNIISNSMCWRITKPIRVVLDSIKKTLKFNRYTHLLSKALFFLKTYGVKRTYKKVRLFIRKKNINNNINEDVLKYIEGQENYINISGIKPLKSFNKKIAVHVHLYYVDLIDEFVTYLNNIPYSFDLFVSCRKDANIDLVTRKFKKIKNVNNVDIETTINRGRDIAPLYVQFGKKIEGYDYFLHVHTKKSLYTGKEMYGWRQYSLDSLLGSEDIVKSIFSLFESDKKVGIFCPEVHDDVPALGLTWLANAKQGREILESLGVPFEDGVFTYPVGSLFWAKMDAVKPLFEYNFKYDDFPEEVGQTDGTTAHALERVIAFVSKKRGYQMAIYEPKSNNIYFGRTLKPFQEYFSLDIYAVRHYLSQFEVVSFDIFDTLITRCVYQPDDVFLLMRRKIKQKYKIDIDFLTIRKKAESIAWEKNHEFCSIHNIYNELYKVAEISKEMAMELKQMEIDTELAVCIPRRDMLNVFNFVKNNVKKVILISDMYLTSDVIKQMLSKCGFEGYKDLWISCEKGGRKDNDTIWDSFFAEYGNYKTIHVGDNGRSDIQIVGDKGKETFFVFDPVTAFKLSKNYSKFKKYINTTLENSLMLGMLVNGGLYNSPFAQQQGSPEIIISEANKLGYIAFGAIFANFTKYIDDECNNNSTLLFLAREGYLFEKIYKIFSESIQKKPLNHIYFLSSRRAATVAAISNSEDIKDILNQYYEGGLINLLKVRLGVDLYDDMKECKVTMPYDEKTVMNMLKPHINDIIKKAKDENGLYRKYIDDVLKEDINGELSIIDVGYSGTIQYHLSKFLNKKISGYYLCTGENKKPEKIGCECNSLYQLDTIEERENSKVFKCQLFLEAAMQAPYGQLLCFKNENGGISPKFNDDNKVPSEITDLQDGIMEYCKQYFTIVKDIIDDVKMDKNLSEDIFYEILFNNDFSKDICSALNVQDDYCSNGSHKFDIKQRKWNVT
ncbi:rhamnan synthesis F family protein [Clostridium tagluense]|uniref:rhamnan synthesis F family protein n=1 Tax=Clostridium tagluense TaxID=360422 RepID=UPI001C0B2F71|nr:rhamnan synthesis F family protein [Clostridium tagluense]MBU3127142.1 methyltransferase domain-containing protein [Clostridium tagluense]